MEEFIPHGYCLHWEHSVLWTLVSADSLIAISYFSIPFALWFLARKRPDIPHRWLFILFGLFIIACGITHFFDIVTIWIPNYWLNAISKIVTALLSIATAIAVWSIMPSALRAPTTKQLQVVQHELELANHTLEEKVLARTRSLEHANKKLEHALKLATAVAQAEEKIHTLSFYDSLTGLANKELLIDRLDFSMRNSSRTKSYNALFFINIDNLKQVNETLGYEAGDKVIIKIAATIKSLTHVDDTLARINGDNFILVANEIDSDQENAAYKALHIAERLQAKVNEGFMIDDLDLNFTLCIGIAIYLNHNYEVAELLKRGHIALDQAKGLGRNQISFFDVSFQHSLNDKVVLERLLHKAIPSELELYYQAQVDHHNTVIGAEALIRWNSPEKGLVSPNEFIPMAEQTGLILDIGSWVLEAACKQLHKWQNDLVTQHLHLAVNVSARQFAQANFVTDVVAVIEQNKIDPHLLELELTESILISNVGDVIEKMHVLKNLGVRFSLDDFGTGYSSLSQLKNLPLNKIKIDQSFISDITSNSSDAAIVRSTVALGNSFGFDVIAEGVETEEQRDFLRVNGCMMFQGYLFSKPVPIKDFENLVAKYIR